MGHLECSVDGCGEEAVRALLNKFGWLHLECREHSADLGTRGVKLVRVPDFALEHVRPLGSPLVLPPGVTTETLEIPMDVALALYVMHG